ncbi:retropepsin-like aspartic protease [soil metagenome]
MSSVPVLRRWVTSAGLAALTAPVMTALAARAQSLPSSTPEPGERTKALDAAGRLTVQVFINGRGPYAFLVDTGANASVVSMEVAATLNLPSGPPVSLHSIAGVQLAATALVDSIRVGRRERRRLSVSVLPGRLIGADGILGMDWLGGQGLTLDFADKQMRVGASQPRGDEYSVTVPTMVERSGLSLIEAQAGGARTVVFLDTGSTATVGNQALMAEAIRRRGVSSAWTDLQLVSLTGQTMMGRVAALKYVRLGTITLRNLPVVFGPVHTFDYWGLTDRPALLLGVDVLKAFEEVSLDYRRGAVHFRLSSSSAGRSTAAS